MTFTHSTARQGIPATPPQNRQTVPLLGVKQFFRVITE